MINFHFWFERFSVLPVGDVAPSTGPTTLSHHAKPRIPRHPLPLSEDVNLQGREAEASSDGPPWKPQLSEESC